MDLFVVAWQTLISCIVQGVTNRLVDMRQPTYLWQVSIDKFDEALCRVRKRTREVASGSVSEEPPNYPSQQCYSAIRSLQN